jgi:solute carrier family 12 (sodium/potassium/chloride transporter), member 2
MYLRFGWVVGNVGLLGTLVIVTLSTAITFLTSLSIAAIATNTPVKGGGAYFLISRSLGLEAGGAIGIPLFLAQAFSVSLYIIGFSESLLGIFPSWDPRWIGVVTTVFLGALAMISTKATIKAQYIILGIIGISLISFALGKPVENTEIELWGVPEKESVPFWKVFAVFFPAVTGIMAGVNLSGDLKDPAISIPKGTFMAVGTGYLIYMTLPVLLASRADALTLVDDPLIMQQISLWGGAIFLGIWGATLSSAAGSLLGAPRVLQALAEDRVLTGYARFFQNSSGKENIPRNATLFTVIITLVTVFLGNLNAIAPILTMFFLTTYAVLNITAGIETFLKSPSFRPKFKVHWVFSLIGAVGCAAVMILINPWATFAAFLFIGMVFLWLKRRKLSDRWGGIGRGLLLSLISFGLLKLENKARAKNWRPNILVLSGSPNKRWQLIEMANSLTQDNSLFTMSTILPEQNVPQEKVLDYESQMMEFLKNKSIKALVRVIRAKNPFSGGKQLVDAYGLGPLVPNTILLGDTQDPAHLPEYAEMVRHFHKSKRNVLILQNENKEGFKKRENVDIWWGGLKGNGSLMIILAYLMKNSPEWGLANFKVKMVVPNLDAELEVKRNFSRLFSEMRTGLSFKTIVDDKRDFWSILHQESAESDLVMLGMAHPEGAEDFARYFEGLKKHTSGEAAKVFVLAAQDIEFQELLR